MPKLIKTAQVKLNVEVFLFQEDEYFVAYCPALNISAYADTPERAQKAFEVEMNIFIEETNRKGTFEKYLLQNGWQLKQVPQPDYKPPKKDLNNAFQNYIDRSTKINKEIAIPCC